MLSPLLTVLPIFALILAGWCARKVGVLGSHATTELNRFVVYLALPAVLFQVMASARWADLWQPGFMAAFFLGSLTVFVLTVLWRKKAGLPLADAAVDGLSTSYPNSGYMGLPLAVLVLGEAVIPAVSVGMILTVCGIFAVGIVLIEIGLRSGGNRRAIPLKVLRALGKNPLLVAPALGVAFSLAGGTIPPAVETFLKMLGGAASPCALVALGLFLAAERPQQPPSAQHHGHATPTVVGAFVLAKLVLQPAITWALALWVFRLPTPLVHTATLLAALPTGTGPFMLAELYNREASVTARVILASTLLSVLTLWLYLTWGLSL